MAINSKIVFTTNSSEVGQKLRELAKKVKDRSVPAKQLAVQLLDDTQRNFETYGSVFKNPWPQLAASTQAYKTRLGFYQMLVGPGRTSGMLRDGFYQYSTNNYAAVGNKVLYASFHETGTSRMPRRQIMPSKEWAVDRGIMVFKAYLKKSVQEVKL